jgi:imidazolonepropionase-like amidohydrolase
MAPPRLRVLLGLLTVLAASGTLDAQRIDALGPQVRKSVSVSAPKVILEHVEIIDGTGAAPMPDRNLVLENGTIAAITPGADVAASEGTAVLDLKGDAVMPGIVGMHGHLFYLALPDLRPDGNFERPGLFHQMSFSNPRLYLSAGVTTMRTAGSVDPFTDLRIKGVIEKGRLPGPHLDVTGPYLQGKTDGIFLQMHELAGPEDARQTVAYWADRGVTSFKAYKNITREELRAAVEEAHKRGLKVTGHLCSIAYEEAAEIGIDDIEHGFFTNTARDPGKKLDTCTDSEGDATLEHTSPGSPDADRLFATLVAHHTAITSTMPGLAATLPPADGRPAVPPWVLEAMSPAVREGYLYGRSRAVDRAKLETNARLLRRDMDLERAFVAAGGLLLAGSDPVGLNGNIPGFGDQREIELLVEAGFAPVEAIRIATLNGATYLGQANRIGSIAVGKNADLVVLKGDPAARISDVENVQIVFKDGVGYDPAKLLDSVKGHYGEY